MNNEPTREYAKIINFLSQNIGLNPDSIGYNSIVNIINQRLKVHGLQNKNSYLQILQNSTSEFSTLVESIIVPETSFFRNRESFTFVQNYVQKKWLLTKKTDVLRILSLPCSTGEEPYSIAITLLEAGLLPEQFQIDAVDISPQALNKARRGLYRYYSFGKPAIPERQKYFYQTAQGYQLQDLIRSCVNFQPGNLLEEGFLGEQEPYDLIFCRNLLIYFHPGAQLQAMEVINRLLVEQGILLIGYAETRQVDTNLFAAINYPLAFAYQKQSPVNRLIAEIGDKEQTQELTETLSGKDCDTSSNPSSQTPNTKQEKASSDLQELEKCRHLANWGQLEAAEKLCEAYLRRHPLDAQAYVLRGEIYQAMGKEQRAEVYFRKAIYLEPNCYQALVYLALFKEYQGDHMGATLMRRRIERLTDNELLS